MHEFPFYKQRFAENHLSPKISVHWMIYKKFRLLPSKIYVTLISTGAVRTFGNSPPSLIQWNHRKSHCPFSIPKKDLDEWANAVARCLYMVGLPGDIFQNSSGLGMFTGGLGFQYGAERLGMLTVPAAAGNTKTPVKVYLRFQDTALHAISQRSLQPYEVMQEMGLTLAVTPN